MCNIYLYILIKKIFQFIYWSVKCIKKILLYLKIYKIEQKKKNKNNQTSANEIKFNETNSLTHS